MSLATTEERGLHVMNFLFTSTIIISSFGHLELVLACKGQNAYGQRQNVTPRTWLNLQAAVRIQAL